MSESKGFPAHSFTAGRIGRSLSGLGQPTSSASHCLRDIRLPDTIAPRFVGRRLRAGNARRFDRDVLTRESR